MDENLVVGKLTKTRAVLPKSKYHLSSAGMKALSRKLAEIEYMSQLLQEKDEMIDNLQDNMEECQAGLDELRKIEEAIKKIQGDGIQVLSLSERLFLMQNTNVGKSVSLQMEHLEVKGWDISKEYEEESRKVELLIQKLLEPDREKQTIGVKYKYPDSKVTALQI